MVEFIKYMSDVSLEKDLNRNTRESTPEERREFLDYFKETINTINQVAVTNWWMVGGVARDATVGKKNFTVKQSTGEWRDLDIVASRETAKAITAIMKSKGTPLHVGMSMNTVIKPQGESQLQFSELKMKVPDIVFETKLLRLGEVEFPSFSAQTLLHLYCTGERPGGKMRDKDFLNVLELARFIKNNPDSKYPESLYEGFHRFSRLKNKSSKSFEQFVMDIAVGYRNSRLNDYLPINHPTVLPIVEHIWEIIEGTSAPSR